MTTNVNINPDDLPSKNDKGESLYYVEIMCEHVETRGIYAKNKKEAQQKIKDNEHDSIECWHCEGNIYIQSVYDHNWKQLKLDMF